MLCSIRREKARTTTSVTYGVGTQALGGPCWAALPGILERCRFEKIRVRLIALVELSMFCTSQSL